MYLKHHYQKGFQEASLTQIIKDIKRFLHFRLKNAPKIDLSLLNSDLWIGL